MRPIAFIDLETTGLDPDRHEIVELGVILVDRNLRELDSLSLRVQPRHLETADPRALILNGFFDSPWGTWATLREAMEWLSGMVTGAMLAGHNPSFDLAFLDRAWKHTGVEKPEMDHHLLDTATLAWPLMEAGRVTSLSLSSVCRALGIEQKQQHRALADARASLEIARALLPGAKQAIRLKDFTDDERAIVETLMDRMGQGRAVYGPWNVDDGRDYRGEAFEEVIDALHYCAASLVRGSEEGGRA